MNDNRGKVMNDTILHIQYNMKFVLTNIKFKYISIYSFFELPSTYWRPLGPSRVRGLFPDMVVHTQPTIIL